MAKQHRPPEFVRLPDKLLAALLMADQRATAHPDELPSMVQQASSIATAYLMGLGVDTDKHVYRIELERGGLVRDSLRAPALALLPHVPTAAANESVRTDGKDTN
jgi:hypothetical protein